ncbi:MAG: chemotaxis protein CheA [Deltaproteobacteria bacterium]|nr:chemotaxis protein CheA [Deltaproteobacteria bacterium]
MPRDFEEVEKHIEDMALEVVTLEEEDLLTLGRMMNSLEAVGNCSDRVEEPLFHALIKAIRNYLERLILAEEKDISPLEAGVLHLQGVFRSMSRGEPFEQDITPLLEKLGSSAPGKSGKNESTAAEGTGKSPENDTGEQARELTDEDREILHDFVSESLENLASIEVSLIDLEDNPENLDTMNAIFRPFHTIKGVSGFLNLGKINKLAHSAENLLNKARDGEITVEGDVVDLVLESVDVLKQMIKGVQEGLESNSLLDNGIDINPLLKKIDAFQSNSEKIAGKPLGQILIEDGVLDKEKLEKGLQEQGQKPGKKLGRILVEEGAAAPRKVVGALRRQKKFGGKKGIGLQVKVDTRKLDTLVDLTGELVIAQAMLRQNDRMFSHGNQDLYKILSQFNQITSTLQKTAMSLRMVSIRSTFQKMVRLVRDLSKHSGKQVTLTMEGEETEIDRNVVEELYEPMVHMIRNAVDHGIEDPETREANGKPAGGVVHLRAYHRGGNIVIEIADDGRGLDRDAILHKARASGLIGDDAIPGDADVYHMIFQPGFSTAKEVTEISGRGVGMDVVKKAIEKLKGRVEITSSPGKGCLFTIHLPLTLAIIEGMVVKVGKERYIIPALAILESFRPEKALYSTVEGKGEMVLVRGRLLPLIRLDRIVGAEGKNQNPWEALAVAVEHEGQQMCLLVDDLLGKEEVVIKSLGESLKHVEGIAGGAIMGDGRVGLILDMAGLFHIAREEYIMGPVRKPEPGAFGPVSTFSKGATTPPSNGTLMHQAVTEAGGFH